MKPLGPCDTLLCIEKGRDPAVSTDDTDPLLRELWDERRDRVEGVGGRGFSSSLLNSLNSLSRPGCICRAIMGKWFSKSPKDLTSFLRGIDEPPAADELPTEGSGTGAKSLLNSLLVTSAAGMIGMAS